MRRREFITLLGGTVAWPSGVRAQQPTMLMIGVLRSTPAKPFAHIVAALREGLKALVGLVAATAPLSL